MFLSDSQLQQIMPRLPESLRMIYLPYLNHVMQIYYINNNLRIAAFLAQIAHESGELRYMEEIWGPTQQQLKYEPPSSLATRLGNTQPGDGYRFRGRGPIQITGRFNYQKYGDLLGFDIVRNPDLAKTPQIAFSIAGIFWQSNGLNELADVEDFVTITKRINGGLNGYQDRLKYYNLAKSVLGVTAFRSTRSRSASAARSTSRSAPVSIEDASRMKIINTLPRGQEAIEEVLGISNVEVKPAPKPKTKKAATKPARKSAAKSSGKSTAKAAAPGKSTAKPTKKAGSKSSKKSTRKPAAKPAVGSAKGRKK